MPKTYYAEYINHVLRFYVQTSGRNAAEFSSLADRLNYQAAEKVMSALNETDRAILCDVFASSVDPLSVRVYTIARARKIPHPRVWTLINRVSREIATERNLIGGGT
ncbi:MAG: hypothetical protein IJW55_07490 [Clostridia bacterium]|nr:hypothetical protein [Clostridia bacterium]